MSLDKKNKILTLGVVVVLGIIAIGITFAFLTGRDAINTDFRTSVSTNTTDSLVFNVDTDISITANMSNFTEGLGNQSGSANATAILKANNKTNSATGNYYLYLDIKENTFNYVTEGNTPELILQVIDESNNIVTSLNGLDYVTVTDGKGDSISGFDITTKRDLITIVSNKEITTTSEKTDSWNIKVIFVNLDKDQTANGGKKFNASIIIQKETLPVTLANYVKGLYTGVQGENNIYYHDKTLENGAGDNSYRYSGSYEEVNNYVCFGSDEILCPHDNLYRIIGVFDNQVKLIKADYAKSTELGNSGDYKGVYSESGTNKGSNTTSDIGGYYWNYNNGTPSNSNTWANSKLNTENLNGTYLNGLGTTWQSKIAMTTWKVGGNTLANIMYTNPAVSYQKEIVSPAESTTESKKIGLMYASDYGFAADPSAWETELFAYNGEGILSKNWMYNGLMEWTISRISDSVYDAFIVDYDGDVYNDLVYNDGLAVRPVFYLESNVVKYFGTGTSLDPYRISDGIQVEDKTVRVVWNDAGYESVRPENVSLVVQKNGETYSTLTLNADNNWTITADYLTEGTEWSIGIVFDGAFEHNYYAATTATRIGSSFIIIATYNDGPDSPDPTEPTDPIEPPEPPI